MITWELGFWSTWAEREWFIFSITKDNFLFLKGITLAIFQVLGKFQIHSSYGMAINYSYVFISDLRFGCTITLWVHQFNQKPVWFKVKYKIKTQYISLKSFFQKILEIPVSLTRPVSEKLNLLLQKVL